MDASGGNINRGKDLSDFIRGRIFSLRFDCEWTYGKIAKKLEISLSTVKMYCQRAQKGILHLIERIVGDNFALLREMLEPL